MTENNNLPNLMTVNQFIETFPAFTMGGMRSYIFKEQFNGLRELKAIKRIGKKIFIDVEAFFRWVDKANI